MFIARKSSPPRLVRRSGHSVVHRFIGLSAPPDEAVHEGNFGAINMSLLQSEETNTPS